MQTAVFITRPHDHAPVDLETPPMPAATRQRSYADSKLTMRFISVCLAIVLSLLAILLTDWKQRPAPSKISDDTTRAVRPIQK